MPVAIVGALEEEVKSFVEAMATAKASKWGKRTLHQGTIGDSAVVAVAGGVGKVKAAACAQYLIDHYSIEALFCSGVAGAVNPRLTTGDLVISEKTLEHDFDPGDPKLLKRFRRRWLQADAGLVKLALQAAGVLGLADRCHRGRVLTGDQAIVSREKRQWLWETFHADCVDMESAAVAQVCRLNGVPWVVVRAISDSAEEDGVAEFRANLALGAQVAARVTMETLRNIRTA
jgi:adenosylhomocysteine nucleosidase